jgi:hypothetical protein
VPPDHALDHAHDRAPDRAHGEASAVERASETSREASSDESSERAKEAFWAAITQFNLFPAQYWHDSWRKQVSARIGSIGADLDAQPFWIRAMSTAILREQQLEGQFDFDFADRYKRLALLDGPTLYRLCLALAGLLVKNHLRLLVSRDDASLIQRCLGPDVHRLVLEWRGPMPVAASPPSWSADWRSSWADSDAWARRGVATLYSALPYEIRAVTDRLRLKFPAAWPEASFKVSPALGHRQINGDVILKILPLIAPNDSWLLAQSLATTEVAA